MKCALRWRVQLRRRPRVESKKYNFLVIPYWNQQLGSVCNYDNTPHYWSQISERCVAEMLRTCVRVWVKYIHFGLPKTILWLVDMLRNRYTCPSRGFPSLIYCNKCLSSDNVTFVLEGEELTEGDLAASTSVTLPFLLSFQLVFFFLFNLFLSLIF